MRTSKAVVIGKAIIGSNIASVARADAAVRFIRAGANTKAVNARLNVGLDTSKFRWHRIPTPATDGAQLVFSMPNGESYAPGLLEVFVDGILQTKDIDYVETSDTQFTFTNAPDIDEALRINYIRQ